MEYMPTQWANGDIVTAEKLNKAEQGIVANDTLVIHISLVEVETEDAPTDAPTRGGVVIPSLNQMRYVADVTAGEVYNAAQNGRRIHAYRTEINPEDETQSMVEIWRFLALIKEEKYRVVFLDLTNNGEETLLADNASDYLMSEIMTGAVNPA